MEGEVTVELIKAQSECQKLLEEIKELKANILSLTAERDDLKFHICPELEAEYINRIGNIELRVLNAKLEVLRLKRVVEIIQAQINRQEQVSEVKARKQAQKEYQKFEDDLNQKAEKARSANKFKEDEEQKEAEWQKEQEERAESGDDKAPKYESRSDEIKALYRRIVKALHPDTNPDETEAEKELFREAVEAMHNGDLDKLREIAAMIDEGKISENEIDVSPENIDKLKEILEGLKIRIESLQEEIAEIKNSFPYTEKEFLEDEELVSERQKELTDLLYEYNEQIIELTDRIADMLNKAKNG